MSTNTFKPLGEFGYHFAEFNLNKAKAAAADDVSALNGDYSWKTHLAECPDQVAKVARVHPPSNEKATDTTLKVCDNHKKAREKFILWLKAEGSKSMIRLSLIACTIN